MPADPNSVAIQHAQRVLDDHLRDFRKTYFRDVALWQHDATPGRSFLVCGSLNAPNAAGGRVGWARFTVSVFLPAPGSPLAETDRVWVDGNGPEIGHVSDQDFAVSLADSAFMKRLCDQPEVGRLNTLVSADIADLIAYH